MKSSYVHDSLDIWSMVDIDLQDQWIGKLKIG
jgi:hypothetical protein